MKEVAVGIIIRDGSILVCQRSRTARYALKWEFPGGKLEPGELPAHALARELHEELSIDAIVGKEFHRQEWSYPDDTFRVHYFLIPSFQGVPANNVFEQIRWVSLPELQMMDILEGNREAVDLLVSHGIPDPLPRP